MPENGSDRAKSGFKGWYSRGYLPHFDAAGKQQFITYRLADSIPAEMRREWEDVKRLEDDRQKFQKIESMLDRGCGACHLRDVRLAKLIEDSLWFNDGKSYRLLAWVIMPNHVHILAEMWRPLAVVVKSWKSFTASKANELLKSKGTAFWQPDYFDRYIRDREHYLRVIRYIENNPVKVGLVTTPPEWPWSSARLRGEFGADEIPKRSTCS